MKTCKIIKDCKIAFNGIDLSTFSKGETVTLEDVQIDRLVELKLGEKIKVSVNKETKVISEKETKVISAKKETKNKG